MEKRARGTKPFQRKDTSSHRTGDISNQIPPFSKKDQKNQTKQAQIRIDPLIVSGTDWVSKDLGEGRV